MAPYRWSVLNLPLTCLQDSRDSNLTFKPQLNQRSLQLAREREARALFEQPSAALRPASAGVINALSENATFVFELAGVMSLKFTRI